jgi:glycosyltransferase involved in cell wall biosynthesis
MNKTSRVLALIPAYNSGAENLAATLASMLAQTAPVDICLIDDGSSPPIEVPSFARERTRLLRLARNGGITVALRAGVQHALEQGYEFVCRLDVGDLSYPDRVRKQLEHLDRERDVDLVGAFARIVGEDGRTLFFHGVNGGPMAVQSYLWKNAPFRHSTFFIRTRVLAERGSYDVAFDGGEDYELLLRLAKSGRIDCLPETLIDYVVDPKGISETRRARQLRRRLKAPLRHRDTSDLRWYAGVLRTLIVIMTPRRLALQASLWFWSRRSARRQLGDSLDPDGARAPDPEPARASTQRTGRR